MQLTERNLGRLFRMPIPELVCRGKQETYKWVDRVRPSWTADRDAVVAPDSLMRFVEHAEKFFFPGAFDHHDSGSDAQAVLAVADDAMRGRFDLLGYRGVSFGNPIDWHLDPVSGRRAPSVHWSRVDPLDPAQVGDSKVIWELNRHQWLVHLGRAWRATGDAAYARRVVETIGAWLRVNPPGIGINWASSLEVAFRLIAWSWSLLLIRDSAALTPAVFRDIERALIAHARHIERYLSYYFSPNTHLTGEALGLVYAGTLLRDTKHAAAWRELGSAILVREIERQVHPDGVYMERSTCYQRYTADIYLQFVILARKAGITLPAIVEERLRKLVDALVSFRQPDGSIPDIGDADSGCVVPLSHDRTNDCTATFSTAAMVFEDPVFAWAAGRVSSETKWLLGGDASFDAIGNEEPAATNVFPVGGFVTIRGGSHAMIFDAGPLGCRYSAGHGHASLLSIHCSAFGEPFIVDSGTGCYTADRALRDSFRTTAAHSTITVDGESQAQPRGPFSWHERPAARLLQWQVRRDLVLASGYSDAYARLADPVKHRRRIAFVDSRYWIVIDDLCGGGVHRIDLRFQFAPVHLHIHDNWALATKNGECGLIVRAFASHALTAEVRPSMISPSYGSFEAAPALVCSANARLPMRILTLLWPAEDVRNTPDLEILRDGKGRPEGIRTVSETVLFDEDDIHVRHRGNH